MNKTRGSLREKKGKVEELNKESRLGKGDCRDLALQSRQEMSTVIVNQENLEENQGNQAV